MLPSIRPSVPDVLVLVQIFPLNSAIRVFRPPTQSKAKQGKGKSKRIFIVPCLCVCCVLARQYVRERKIGGVGKAVVK
jgi:hypothetical protein